MARALTETLAVIGKAGASLPGSEFGRIPDDLSKSIDDRYMYLRFKHSDGQPTTYVRVTVGKNVGRN